jgi:YebC/PmpR family DNA-binding regulatory protein
VVLKAREVNMPSDNIERNIKKASSADQADFSEFTYEMYGYGGVGMILDIMTDNKNRISSDVRIAMNKKGGTLASPGAVAYNFDQKGVIQVQKKNALEDELFLAVSEAGADEFETEDEMYIITTPPELLFQVKEAIDKMGIKCESAELQRIPKVYVECSPEDQKSNLDLIEYLEGLDDIDAVHHNMKLE